MGKIIRLEISNQIKTHRHNINMSVRLSLMGKIIRLEISKQIKTHRHNVNMSVSLSVL